MWAAHSGSLEIVQELIANGADMMKAKGDGITVFHMAASNNDIHMLDYALGLKRHGNDLELKNEDGWTPAHMAGILNNFDSLNLLIENGASISTKNKNGLSVYEEIVRSDNADLLECIYPELKRIIYNRDPNEKASFGLLHLAAGNNGPKVLNYLLSKVKEAPN